MAKSICIRLPILPQSTPNVNISPYIYTHSEASRPTNVATPIPATLNIVSAKVNELSMQKRCGPQVLRTFLTLPYRSSR